MDGLNFEGRVTVKMMKGVIGHGKTKCSQKLRYLSEVSDSLAAITQANFHVRLFHILKILVVSAIKFLV